MKRSHTAPRMRDLAVKALLLLILFPSMRTQATDTPPGWLTAPASVERGMVLPTYTGCGSTAGVPSSNETYEQEVVDRVNTVRAGRGLPAHTGRRLVRRAQR